MIQKTKPERFKRQVLKKTPVDDESMHYDAKTNINALEYGLHHAGDRYLVSRSLGDVGFKSDASFDNVDVIVIRLYAPSRLNLRPYRKRKESLN